MIRMIKVQTGWTISRGARHSAITHHAMLDEKAGGQNVI
jgi:hypothetical protein